MLVLALGELHSKKPYHRREWRIDAAVTSLLTTGHGASDAEGGEQAPAEPPNRDE